MKKLLALLTAALLVLTGCTPAAAPTPTPAGSAPTAAPVSAAPTAFEETVDWGAEYDVIVAGFGAAGAATAITAADAGAKVLLLEKAPEGEAGGNSAICMQWIAGTTDEAQTLKYFQTLRGDYATPSDDLLKVYVAGIAGNPDWLTALGAPNMSTMTYTEFPENEGADSYQPYTVDGNTGMGADHFGGSGEAYRLLKQNVFDRSDNIDVWYEAPATRLIQDGITGIVHGVTCTVEGQTVSVRARNGVVLCTGGFESNPEMQQNYTQRTYWPATGNAWYNTGDGIQMALDVGADLWHMSNVVTNMEFYNEETKTSTFAFQGTARGILVGGDGTRFMNETERLRHGKIWNHGNWANSPLPDTMWSVFDQTGLEVGPLHFGWSENSVDELSKGWVKQADTLEELAVLLEVPADSLKASVEKWNSFCAGGEDLAFGRAAGMTPITSAPYYAIKVTPCMGNTQGGPVRNEKGEVLTPYGEPIPHLYEAGELGDIWSNCYQAGNNFGGGLVFGRISGTNAAAPKADNLQASVLDGKTPFQPAGNSDAEYTLGENEYLGKGQGKGGTPIVVKVTLDGDAISKVEILEHTETPGISDPAITGIPQAIVAANSADVDVVASATLTSDGIIEAVKNALTSAGK